MKGLVRFVSLLDDGTPEDVSFPPGVLPLPKPDENQTDFISVGDVYQMPFFALPVTNPEPSAVRRLLEAMAADGEALCRRLSGEAADRLIAGGCGAKRAYACACALPSHI